MAVVYVVQKKQKVSAVVQGKRAGTPSEPAPLPTYCFKVVDTRTDDYVGEFECEDDAQKHCDHLNAKLQPNPKY